MIPVISAKDLGHSFDGRRVLRDISVTVEKGEIFGLIGPSGAGKSTLVRALTGYLQPSEGEVEVLGKRPSTFGPDDRRRLGFMPQDFVLYEDLSVSQNLNFVAGLYGLRLFDRRRAVGEALQFVELWDHRKKRASRISGGMQRRLQLAAAIVHRPELLFFDEPTANLDPVLRHKFWDEFSSLRDQGHTLIITTQYVGEAERCDRIGFLTGGTLLSVGTPQELRRAAFGGELISLSLRGDIGDLGEPLSALERVGRLSEVREESGVSGTISHARLLVEDADIALPKVFRALDSTGASALSADVLIPSFDEVFFRLVQENSRS
ncbi:MAG: ABC transporter ATP-binding protein [Actinomycetota bacterium]